MLYRIDNDKLVLAQRREDAPGAQYVGFFTPEAAAQAAPSLGVDVALLSRCGAAISFEAREKADVLCAHSFFGRNLTGPQVSAAVHLVEGLLLFVSKEAAELEKTLMAGMPEHNVTLSRILFLFLETLTAKHMVLHESIETEITELENDLLNGEKRECVKEIVALRRTLMALKRYYEQMLNALDLLQQNENEFISPHAMRYFRLYNNRVDRLYHGVLNLRDYVTQVRESYQAEVDISLNNIMKVFTVITAIFLPLSLIAGWYGMNLRMPEYGWPYSYLMVIALSVAVVAFCIGYFKKKNWF